MTSTDVLAVVTALEGASLFASVDGGWGVDALPGCGTRPHDDLDLAIDIEQMELVHRVVEKCGYCLQLEEMPTKFVLVADGDRRSDFHPMYFDDTGNAHQRLPGGRIFTCRIRALGAIVLIGLPEVCYMSPSVNSPPIPATIRTRSITKMSLDSADTSA